MIGEVIKVDRDEKIFTRLVIQIVRNGEPCGEEKYGIRFTDKEIKKIMQRMKLKYKKDFTGKKVFLMEHRIYILAQNPNTQGKESYTSYLVT